MKAIPYILAGIAVLSSCAKNMDEPAADNMTELHFCASMESAKATLNGKSIEWTGEETIYVWYKDNTGSVKKTRANFDSFSGKEASLWISIPQDADMDDFYAEVNGIIDNSAEFYPWGAKGPRTATATQQQAVADGFDQSACALGARWIKSETAPKPFFTFKSLQNLIGISVDNQSGKIIDCITLSSSSNLACKNYWFISESGSMTNSFSANIGNSIMLTGNINEGKALYYFFVPIKNNNGSKFKLDDIKLQFHSTDGSIYENRNSTPLELEPNSFSIIGDFILTPNKLKNPEAAPFGTYWGASFMVDWHNAGWVSNTSYTGVASYDTRAVASAKATASASAAIQYNKGGNERLEGMFSFEFTTADSGNGILTFWSCAGSTSHTTSILRNGQVVKTVTYSTTNDQKTECKITVTRGDVISIKYNNGSNYAHLYCGGEYNSLDKRIRWDNASEADGGAIPLPKDYSDDDQSDFFNEL